LDCIRVILADDHPVVRSGIRALVERAPDINVIGEASSGTEAVQMVTDYTPDVLLLDMEMPDMSGLEVAQHLQSIGSRVRVLALSAYADEQYVLGVLESGAVGYLTKDEAPTTIVEAVRGVARGERGWMSRRATAQLTASLWEDRKKHALTPRELDVLQLVALGRKNRQIALELQISEKTVEKHLGEIYSKLGVESRVAAVRSALDKGLIKPHIRRQ
jgi:DNA-binding NarL/FixJ family response regulator